MSAAEMREAAARYLCAQADKIDADEDDSATWGGPDPRGRHASDAERKRAKDLRLHAAAIRALPLPDEEGMVERVARAMCFAWHYAKPRTPDGEAEWARERSRLMAQARAALHVINGGAEGGEARQHIEALLSLHIAHHNNPIHGAARAFLSKREAK